MCLKSVKGEMGTARYGVDEKVRCDENSKDGKCWKQKKRGQKFLEIKQEAQCFGRAVRTHAAETCKV